MFQEIQFWCEFPEEVDWAKLNSLLNNRKCSIFIAASSKKEFLHYKNKIKINITVGVWPILKLKDGYWFSSFASKKDIKQLNQFAGIPMKIDIEPPFPNKKYGLVSGVFWLIKYTFFKKQINKKLLQETIIKLCKKGDVIISSFAFPKSVRKLYGYPEDITCKRNFIFYTTFFPCLWLYYKLFFRYHKHDYFAIGLANHGIFQNEPQYNSIKDFQDDIQTSKSIGIKKIVIYSIEGILNKPDAKEWLSIIFQ